MLRFIGTVLLIAFGWHSFADQVQEYKSRYGLNNPYDKLVNNVGNGYEPLYGVRNFRVVLHGYVYRGGANNSYNKNNKRSNMNPLQESALRNLCDQGFEQSVYLYKTNFETAPKSVSCKGNSISYFQHSPNYTTEYYEIIKKIHTAVTNNSGPIYLHCWNGWHASGLISAYTLMQFCGYTPEQAVNYWDTNTDGRNQEPKYESIRKRIKAFKPIEKFKIPESKSQKICP